MTEASDKKSETDTAQAAGKGGEYDIAALTSEINGKGKVHIAKTDKNAGKLKEKRCG